MNWDGNGLMGMQTMLFSSVLGCLISLLIIPLVLLPRLMESVASRRQGGQAAEQGRRPNGGPRVGGLVLTLAFLAVVLLVCLVRPAALSRAHGANLHIVWGALAVAGVGLWNDYRRMGTVRLLSLQAVIAGVLFATGLQVDPIDDPPGDFLSTGSLTSGFVTVLWLVSITNLVRIMERVPGLPGALGCAILTLVSFAGWWSQAEFPAMCALGMAGALAGFLVYNLPPSRVRLGGSGASLVGFLIGSLTILAAGERTIIASSVTPFVVVLVLILGAGFAVLRREFTGPLLVSTACKQAPRRPGFPQRGVKPHAS